MCSWDDKIEMGITDIKNWSEDILLGLEWLWIDEWRDFDADVMIMMVVNHQVPLQHEIPRSIDHD